MRHLGRFLRTLALTGLGALLIVSGVGAQQPLAPGVEGDSTRERVMERLRRLSRPPGYDTILFVQDSATLALAAQGIRPQAAGAPDSVLAALLAMPGYTLTEYEAGAADFDADQRILRLDAPEEGRARVVREGMRVEADTSITFDESSGLVRTVGDATFTPPDGDAVESSQMIYDLNQGRGTARDARTEVAQGGATWYVRGDMPYAAQDSSFMSHARFTSCELTEPHYHFETDEIKIVGGRLLVARGVRLYFDDVPVAWLPFMAQSLSQGRASGLLTPRFSVNDIVRTSGSYRRRVSNVGFYWAMSEYTDALVAMDWFSDNFFSITSAFQYNWRRQFLDGGMNFRRFWRADGSTELALDTRHSWSYDERTQLRLSGQFTSSNDFVRENSFNPTEVTQSIDSEGGVNRRFDWGSVSVAANRRQYLSDDRTSWTLPTVNLSLSPITLFRAPSAEASFFNNMTWSGGSNFSRTTMTRVQPDTFSFAEANNETRTGYARSSFSIGNLSWGQSFNMREGRTLGVPESLLDAVPGTTVPPELLVRGVPARDIAQTELGWNTSLDYQQRLVGSTTFTPQISASGSLLRSDTSSVASGFVSAPSRISAGASLKTDIYGFFPGFGGFDALRHKLSPALTYEWSPAAQPTSLQTQVFGARTLRARNALALTVNQTWEARRAQTEPGAPGAPSGTSQGSLAPEVGPPGAPGAPGDPLAPGAPGGGGAATTGPRRMQAAPTVKLLGLTTSVVRYDFVEADSAGSFLAGFQTTQLSNQITSDYLRGLSVAMNHDLFADSVVGGRLDRRFRPHLSQVNLSFSLGASSPIFRIFGFGGGDGEESEEPGLEADPLADPFASEGATDESSMIPRSGRLRPAVQERTSGRGWSANLSYSLQRPRSPALEASQMLSVGLTLYPTENWDLNWRTSYDVEAGAFNDHIIRLSRNLHDWQANFDFLQTATGNWSFRFHVSLIDLSDLKFDYEQRNIDVGLPADQR